MPSRTEYFGYGFSNLGPLTTTYEAPAACTTATTDRIYFANATSADIVFGAARCDEPEPLGKCVPSGLAWDKMMSSRAGYIDQGYWAFHSPGVVCPKGWTTAGTLAHGNKTGSVDKSGVFTQPPFPFGQPIDYLLTPEEILLNVLEPSETFAYCCPSGWSAGQWGGCRSSIEPVSSATYSEICNRYLPPSVIAEVHTLDGTSLTTPLISYMTASYTSTQTRPISELTEDNPTAYEDMIIVRQFPAVAMMYKASDIKEAKETNNPRETGGSEADDDNGASALKTGSFVPLVAWRTSLYLFLKMSEQCLVRLNTSLLDEEAICLLSLDDERRKDGTQPSDVFDLIGGAISGELITIMLGRFRLGVDECIASYNELIKVVFSDKARTHQSEVNFRRQTQALFDSKTLQIAIESTI
ncbi:hypothetical protein FHETE_5772 [Fusarium heterosporum]|uniref:Uncharacterized protein n=1 Tax=Fusarium heterosporum TaxID=42747 RepID=A0A8H5WR61_FUSHE|nr:hypothetical protein FHETE_5772 [Fusarium heterosporum]